MTAAAATPASRLFVGALLLLLLALIVLPVGVLVLGSFLSAPPRALHIDWSGLTLHNYAAVLHAEGFGAVLATTLGAALAGTAGATAIGVTLAWLAVRSDVPGRRVLDAVAVMPLFVPPLVGAFAWDILASPRSGILNVVLRALGAPVTLNIYSVSGVAFAYAIYYAPYVYLFAASALRNMDATLEEAASMSGAGRLLVAAHITLPLILPALLSSSLLVFVLLLELFAIPAVLGEPGNLHFMAVRIWDLIGFTPPEVNQASALGVLMLLLTIALVSLQQWVAGRRSVVTIAGKGQRIRPVPLGKLRWILAAIGFLYLALVVILPFAALLFIALRRNIFFFNLAALLDASQLSLDQFATVFHDPVVVATLQNSLAVSTGTMVIATALYFAVSYIVHRTRWPGRRALDIVTVLPVAIPGIIVGLGYLWSWISPPHRPLRHALDPDPRLRLPVRASGHPRHRRVARANPPRTRGKLPPVRRRAADDAAPRRDSPRPPRHHLRRPAALRPLLPRAGHRALPLHLRHPALLAGHVRLLAARLHRPRRRHGRGADRDPPRPRPRRPAPAPRRLELTHDRAKDRDRR